MKRRATVALLGAAAVLIGSAATFGAIDLINVISPFRPRDDDTLREFVPVAFALLVGVVTGTLIFVLGLRALRARWRRSASSDIHRR